LTGMKVKEPEPEIKYQVRRNKGYGLWAPTAGAFSLHRVRASPGARRKGYLWLNIMIINTIRDFMLTKISLLFFPTCIGANAFQNLKCAAFR
jgi:hypothetical protein